ncbi:MAG: hypothetical protein F4X97_01570 [Boseongicola sp. SB0662_bin_57]|nr:hypothetical protein [Boseongicola sp. SB0662_bin_57]
MPDLRAPGCLVDEVDVWGLVELLPCDGLANQGARNWVRKPGILERADPEWSSEIDKSGEVA